MFSYNIRKDIPFLNSGVIYFDNACMTLRPQTVVQAMNEYYLKYPVCAGRSAHRYAQELTQKLTTAKETIATFFGTKPDKIIFTKNTTESINWIAQQFKQKVVAISEKEHNSNLLVWQKNAKKLFFFSDIAQIESLLAEHKIDLISFVHVSNIDACEFSIEKVVNLAQKHNCKVAVDVAQSAGHQKLNFETLGVDFASCSAHKMLGPPLGLLYVKDPEHFQPVFLGGGSVKRSTQTTHELEDIPTRFDAGLQNYPAILGFSQACKLLNTLHIESFIEHEKKLFNTLVQGLQAEIDAKKIIIINPTPGSIFNFYAPGKDSHEIAQMLDSIGHICVRSGQHCVHSYFDKHNIPNSVRASFYIYNTVEEAQKFVKTLKHILSIIE